MTKRALVNQAELKRMAAIAKSEGVVVSVEVDGRKFSVSPFVPETTPTSSLPKGPNTLLEWRTQQRVRFSAGCPDDQRPSAVLTLKTNRRKAIDVDKAVSDWNAYRGYDPKTMNGDDYKHLFAAKEEERRKKFLVFP